MTGQFDKQINTTKALNTIWKPELYRLGLTNDRAKLISLLNDNPGIYIHDEIESQVQELIKSQNPTRVYKKDELIRAAKNFFSNTDRNDFGIWVHYPWSKRLIHILSEDEFIQVRTNRNQYKITPKEREILAKQKIGVIGLSVGQSVAITMAMERSFGEIRLADFDVLELSNLNRIRTGLHNLSVSKVVAVAREIAEIDPFLEVKCFTEGLTEGNIDEFFTQGGKLDIVIDECDGLDMKIRCREKAKSLQIPVVMDASDRGSLDIERFDLEPDRPIFHGLLEGLNIDVKKIKHLTNEEKVPYLLALHPPHHLSTRMRASMLEVEQTLTTWPQLSSAVTLGGAIAADACRRIALDQFHDSGRYFVDLEEIIADKTPDKSVSKNGNGSIKPLTGAEMQKSVSRIKDKNSSLNLKPDIIKDLVEIATRAPSGGNVQPWKWYYKNGSLYLFHDKARSYALLDFNDMASHIGLGAAVENLTLHAARNGIGVTIDPFPVKDNRALVAHIRFQKKIDAETLNMANDISDMMELRFTSRKLPKRISIPNDKYHSLQEMIKTVDGVELFISQDPDNLDMLGKIVGAAEKIRILHPRGHYDFFTNEVRWNHKEHRQKRDGIDLDSMTITASELAGLRVASDPEVISWLNQWGGGKGMERMGIKNMKAASAAGYVTVKECTPENLFNCGRAIQRMWLKATKLNISIQPLTAPVFLFARITQGKGTELSPEMIKELEKLYKQFKLIFPKTGNKTGSFLFRILIAGRPQQSALRRPLKDVLVIEQ